MGFKKWYKIHWFFLFGCFKVLFTRYILNYIEEFKVVSHLVIRLHEREMSLTNSMASIEEIVKFQQELLNHQRSQKLIQKETIKLLNALNKNITFMSDRLDQFALRTNIKLNNTDQSQTQHKQQQSSSSKAKSSSSYDDVFNSVINTCNSFFNDNKSSSSFLNKSTTTTTTSRHHSTRHNNSNSKTSKTTLKLSDVSIFSILYRYGSKSWNLWFDLISKWIQMSESHTTMIFVCVCENKWFK